VIKTSGTGAPDSSKCKISGGATHSSPSPYRPYLSPPTPISHTFTPRFPFPLIGPPLLHTAFLQSQILRRYLCLSLFATARHLQYTTRSSIQIYQACVLHAPSTVPLPNGTFGPVSLGPPIQSRSDPIFILFRSVPILEHTCVYAFIIL
jgi:hypothetical protein